MYLLCMLEKLIIYRTCWKLHMKTNNSLCKQNRSNISHKTCHYFLLYLNKLTVMCIITTLLRTVTKINWIKIIILILESIPIIILILVLN